MSVRPVQTKGRARKSGTGAATGGEGVSRGHPWGRGLGPGGSEPGLLGWWLEVRAGTGRPWRALGVLFSEQPGSHREG